MFGLLYTLIMVVLMPSATAATPTMILPSFFPGMIELSFEQMVHPFGIWTSGYQPRVDVVGNVLHSHGLLLRLLASSQSILTLALVTELVLAIRWRFRRGWCGCARWRRRGRGVFGYNTAVGRRHRLALRHQRNLGPPLVFCTSATSPMS